MFRSTCNQIFACKFATCICNSKAAFVGGRASVAFWHLENNKCLAWTIEGASWALYCVQKTLRCYQLVRLLEHQMHVMDIVEITSNMLFFTKIERRKMLYRIMWVHENSTGCLWYWGANVRQWCELDCALIAFVFLPASKLLIRPIWNVPATKEHVCTCILWHNNGSIISRMWSDLAIDEICWTFRLTEIEKHTFFPNLLRFEKNVLYSYMLCGLLCCNKLFLKLLETLYCWLWCKHTAKWFVLFYVWLEEYMYYQLFLKVLERAPPLLWSPYFQRCSANTQTFNLSPTCIMLSEVTDGR